MAKDLETQILEEIEKTGFPLELRVSDFLRGREYLVDHSIYYLDKDEGKGREIDLLAHNFVVRQKRKRRWFVDHYLAIECKKSDKPWVIFSSPAVGDERNLYIYDEPHGMRLKDWPTEKVLEVSDQILSIHPLFRHQRQGRDYFIPFASFEANEAIFKALMTSVKAAVSVKENPHYVGRRLCFYYPVVVLQGRLFEAYLENGAIKIQEIEMISIDFAHISVNYAPDDFLVMVVTEKAFGRFIEELEKVFHYWVGLSETQPDLFDFSTGISLE